MTDEAFEELMTHAEAGKPGRWSLIGDAGAYVEWLERQLKEARERIESAEQVGMDLDLLT